jgi:hypothetical protein
MIELKLARQGMLLLLERFPNEMIVKYDAQIYDKREPGGWFDYVEPAPRTPGRWVPRPDGPWICIDLSGGGKFAIWKETGNVYHVGNDGAVEEDPIISVTPL